MTPMAGVTNERALWLARHILPHEPALRSWLQRRRVFDLDIDDIVQEAYARLAGLESVAEIANPRAYFFQAAHSVILTHLRRRQVVAIRAVEDVELWGVQSDAASPEAIVSDRDELYRLGEIIAGLPKKLAQVFTLRRIQGISQKETAEHLGIAESTVEKHMARSLRLFMDALAHSGNLDAGASKSAKAAKRGDHARNSQRD
jgi:RNA polymerase sigma-70 factor (ECF subfamily)